MANVLPVLMYKPKQVVLFSTKEEKKTANNLEKLFTSKSINVKKIEDLNAYDFIGFKNVVNKEINDYSNEVSLNITGGTKLMALAAYEAFAEKNLRIIYCDTEHQNIITLLPEYKIEKLIANLSVNDYLISYGYKIKETKSTLLVDKYFPLFDFILEKNLMNEFILLFAEIRSKQAEDYPKITISSKNKNFVFYKNFDTYSIQYNNTIKKTISFKSSEFKSGDWLEYFVFYILKKKYNLDPLTGVKIISDENVENEIDVLVLKNYMLYNYSCKSGKSDNQYDLFQLETLTNITSGTFGKGIFVSAKKGTKRFLERAKELNIKTINVANNNEEFI